MLKQPNMKRLKSARPAARSFLFVRSPAQFVCDNVLTKRMLVLTFVLSCLSAGGCASVRSNSGSSQLHVQPSTVDFGTVAVGSIGWQSFRISNSGTTPLSVTQVTVTGTSFATPSLVLPIKIAAGQKTSLSVRFAPTAAGNATGGISLVSNATTSPMGILLFGSGLAATSASVISVNPSSLAFPNVNVAGSSTQPLTISNSGGTSLVVNQGTVTGSGFSMSGLTIPLTIAAGQSSSFSVRFAPSQAGDMTGSLSLVSNASNSPTMIVLSGTAAPPPITPPTISGSLPNGTVGSPYLATLTAKGGIPPYTWTLASRQLPAGLTLSQPGVISGTPSSSGSFTFSVQAKDSATSPQAATQSESITVASAPLVMPLWSADMETGDLTQWTAGGSDVGLVDNTRTGTYAASTDQSHLGLYSAKLTLNSDWDNAQMHRWKESRDPTYFGSGLYYSAWFYIPSLFYMTKATSNGNFFNLVQFLSASWTPSNGCNNRAGTNLQFMLPWFLTFQNRTPQSSSPLYILLDWGSGTTPITGPYANSNQSVKLWSSPFQPALNVPIGQWFHIEIYLKPWPHDVTPYHGRIMVWQDSVLMFDMGASSDPNGGITTKPGDDLDGSNLCHGTNEPSWNVYSDGVDSYPSSIYVDDVQISPSPVGP
jgi:hypothetical protein